MTYILRHGMDLRHPVPRWVSQLCLFSRIERYDAFAIHDTWLNFYLWVFHPLFILQPGLKQTRPEIVIVIQKRILHGQRSGFFSNEPFGKRPSWWSLKILLTTSSLIFLGTNCSMNGGWNNRIWSSSWFRFVFWWRFRVSSFRQQAVHVWKIDVQTEFMTHIRSSWLMYLVRDSCT